MMKHVGIAAVTTEGASLVYRRICSFSAAKLGEHCHPEISLHSFSFSEHVNVGLNRHERWADLITQSAIKLRANGADFMICPSNTPHDAYNLVKHRLPFPWLHIARPVLAMAVANRLNKVLLMGTKFTIESNIYDEHFSRSGIELMKPDDDETIQMHKCITAELVNGLVSVESRRFFSKLISKYSGRGAEAVILGCTELPLVVTEEISCLPILDSTIALADAAVEYALKS